MKPFSGYIYAGFAGCILKDSEKINVVEQKQNFAINKDSILCPGKNILLQSPVGFQTYQCQDGSSLSSYLVTKAGFYKVTTTDSCGNIFKDSLTIREGDTSFLLPSLESICPYDTVHLEIPASINNITWQPFENILKIKNQLLFFPVTTTEYRLKGTSTTNCDLTTNAL